MKKRVTLDLPPEFLELCERDGVPPKQVLRAFIADLCEIQPLGPDGRTDGYCSSGSDERRLAGEYYSRVGYAYMRGMWEEATKTKPAAKPRSKGGPKP